MLFVSFYFFYVHMRLLCCSFYFFFSSRRRHTRCLSDWSSDVCSSDLKAAECFASSAMRVLSPRIEPPPNFEDGSMANTASRCPCSMTCSPKLSMKRSEERRVGKECRYRWSPYQ